PGEIEEAAREIVDMGAKAVVIKGGHRTGPPVDLLYDGREIHEFSGPRIPAPNIHGTGCTYSAAIAAFLALGRTLPDVVGLAKTYVTEAIRGGLPLGRGAGPVNHFFYLRQEGPSTWMGPPRVVASEQRE
ncbi:MAG: bifunctional hydroxymethylpyrimidine kinase/phosphomethylpyrimidine kinase, partial [Chloroflexi bacterium]|nr:bifunctional hydroxymethylpyrimidine kinase/phosphomethylpyrimidine kinase [Chloroflexota bacterium]